MNATLNEMKSSGQSATNQTWAAIGNMNWMARTLYYSFQRTRDALDTQERHNKEFLERAKVLVDAEKQSAEAMVAANRAWIVPGDKARTKMFSSGMLLFWSNIGKSPALRVSGTAEYVIDKPGTALTSCGDLKKSNWKNEASILLQDQDFTNDVAADPAFLGA